MSVICGFITWNGDKSPREAGNRMMAALDAVKADKVESWYNDHIFMSCHHQYITPESVTELLPYYDQEAGLVIVAKAILDNRTELLNVFGIQSCDWNAFSDSQLILMAYRRWGESCAKYLLGDFSYAIYEEKSRKLVCSRDHTGRATFYYASNDTYFAFCTLMKPLISLIGDKALNEQWIADFLAVPTVIGELDTSLTVYRDIRQLQLSHTMVLHNGRMDIQRYWDPFNVPKVRFKTDMDYDEAFRDILSESVRCKLRSSGNIGILLSGGFDSCSVGCMAAGLLQAEGRKLKSYTSIPMEGYIERFSKYAMSDESPLVEEIAKMYPNIDATFCRSEGKHPFSDIDKHLEMLEQPYKTVENLFWNADIYEKAQQDKIKVMLSGQYGNITISYGEFFMYFQTLLRSGRLLKLFRETQMYARHYGMGRKKLAKIVLEGFVPGLFKASNQNTTLDRYSRSFPLINPGFSEQYHEEERLNRSRYGSKQHRNYTMSSYRRYAFRHPLLSQIASFENRIDTHYGMITRDPTKDKRLIEFCFGLPDDQYIRGGRDKVILRRSLKGIIPEKIRLNYSKKGVQAADWIQRIIPLWEDIAKQVKTSLQDPLMDKYLNIPSLLRFLDENPELKLSVNAIDVRQVFAAYIFSRFMMGQEAP